jgi:acyl-CoA thioesterase-1
VCARRRRLVVAGVLAALMTTLLTGYLADRARGADPGRCQRFAADSAERADHVTGSGDRVVVIGDSYSAGLGLADSTTSWPSRLPGSVHVAGFSGSGFSETASACDAVSFADRAPAAVRGGADLVVVEGGLNDYDQPAAAITDGFRRLMGALDGLDVVVVGPVSAPSRAGAVPRVDALLASLCRQYDVPYVGTSDLALDYLDDDLHLVPASHADFGDAVAARISGRPAA